MNTERKLIHIGTFSAQIEDTDFGIGNAAVEARFRIRLSRDGVSMKEDIETVRFNRDKFTTLATPDLQA